MTWQLLFIDDCRADAEIASWQLQRAGVPNEYRRVETVDDLESELDERAPNLILVDLVLPQWDCWGAVRACRRLAPVVPLIIYSGAVSAQDRQQAQQRGLAGCADKDLPAELVAIVKKVLNRQ